MSTGLPAGTIKVLKVDDNDNWIEDSLTEEDFPAMVTTTGTQTISGNKTFAENVGVSGTLSANQGITYIQDEDIYLEVQDRFLTLNNELTGAPSEDGGVEINRGSSTNSRLLWDETDEVWKAGISGNEGALLASDYWSINSSGYLLFSGTTAQIKADTSSESNTKILELCGGGASNSNWGAYIELAGNEHADTGRARIVTGSGGGELELLAMGSGKGINFYTHGETTDPKWQMLSSGHLRYLTTTSKIIADTSDGSDSKRIYLCGGGDSGSGRGAYFIAIGNEYTSNAGNAYMLSGDISGAEVYIRNASSDGIIRIQTGGSNDRWKVTSAGYLQSILSHGVIGTDTSDGSDTKILQLMGGGAVDSNPHTRGGYIRLHGNEHTNAGYAQFFSGNAAGKCQIGTRGSGDFELWSNNSSKWVINSDGDLYPTTHQTYDIGKNGNQPLNVMCRILRNYENSTMYIIQDATQQLIFRTDNTNRWEIGGTSGAFYPTTNNTYNIGHNSYRCNSVYSNNYLPFTGIHLYRLKNGETPNAGDAVKLVNEELEVCSSEKDPTCLGVYAGTSITTASGGAKDSLGNVVASGVELYGVAAVGDAKTEELPGVNVCNEGGDISAGDYLCTASGYNGHLKKQDDTLNHNYTKFLVLQDVTFSGSSTASGVYGYFIN